MSDSFANGQRPLVTFALFAYNQEAFIREAVAGALAQTYEPLEIILSDDCSTDRTFEIMKEMAATYDGPHRLVVRQNELNLQTALHVQAVANAMSGELLIVAAGDDISFANRARLTVEAWLASGRTPSVLHGKVIQIDAASGKEVGRSGFRSGCDRVLGFEWYYQNLGLPFFSPACAYSRVIFDRYPPLLGGSVIEDGVLVQRCFLEGVVVPIDHFLIRQRVNHESAGRGFDFTNPSRWNRHVRSRTISAINRLQDLACARGVDSRMLRRLERISLSQIRKMPTFMLPLMQPISLWERALLTFRMMILYPSGGSIAGRVAFALKFNGFLPSILARGARGKS